MEHGKHNSDFCNTSTVKRPLFLGIYTAEGCQKWQFVLLTLHEKQKKYASYGAWEAIFSFLQPFSINIHCFSRTRPV